LNGKHAETERRTQILEQAWLPPLHAQSKMLICEPRGHPAARRAIQEPDGR